MSSPDERIRAEPPPPDRNADFLDEAVTRPAMVPTGDDRSMAVLAHLGGFITWLLLPLIVWTTKKDKSPWAEEHAKEALNFQLALTIYYVVGCLILPVIMVFELVVIIQACIAANRGELYRYPLSIRFIK